MVRTFVVSKLPWILSALVLATGAHAQPLVQPLETRKPSAISTLNHTDIMRLYSWVIISDSQRECNRVLDVQERNDGGVLATCSAYSATDKRLVYRVDRLPLKADFAERWFRLTRAESIKKL